jgi:CBS domain-containing protein
MTRLASNLQDNLQSADSHLVQSDCLRASPAVAEDVIPDDVETDSLHVERHVQAVAQRVADVMTPNPVTVQPDTPLSQVIALLADRRISGLPVVDRAHRLVGVISEADLLWQLTGVMPPAYITVLDSVIMLKNPLSYTRDLHRALGQTVAEVMTSPAVSGLPDLTLPEAAQMLRERRRLPVVDGMGHLVGIITRGDIIRVMARAMTV